MNRRERLSSQAALKTVGRLLIPIARFALRHSLKLQDLEMMLKVALLEAARTTLHDSGMAESGSRLSLMTGVHRRDVKKLATVSDSSPSLRDITTRIIGQWQSDTRFSDGHGKARPLTGKGPSSEFGELVSTVSREISPYVVLFELHRLGIVEESDDTVKLLKLEYASGEVDAGFAMLAEDVHDLIAAVEENLLDSHEIPNVHLRTSYDNVPADMADEIKDWILRETTEFHGRMRSRIATSDRDINPHAGGGPDTVRIAMGSFSRVEPVNRRESVPFPSSTPREKQERRRIPEIQDDESDS
jgi:hypothetical protein